MNQSQRNVDQPPQLASTKRIWHQLSPQTRAQIIAVAIDKAFLQAPLPTDADSFLERVKDGRGRLTLIANEVARTSGDVLVHFTKVQRNELLGDIQPQPEALGAGTAD